MKNARKIVSGVMSAALIAMTMMSATACDDRQELIIYNWGEYIAEDTIAKFEAAYPQYSLLHFRLPYNLSQVHNFLTGS